MTSTGDRRVVVISGVDGGIGRAAAQIFKEAGWYVAGLDLAATAPPGADRYETIDLAAADAETRIDTFLGSLSSIDAVVNNAAMQVVKSLRDTTIDEWNRTMAVNLGAAFLTMRLAHRQLQASRGAVVNVASVHAVATSAGLAAYAASKGGLVALTRAAAVEFAPDGIRVNAVLPGAIDTPMLRAGVTRFGDEGLRRTASHIPLGRIGVAEEAAKAILYLAGPDSGYVTGTTLAVDGGALAALSSE
jgi:NAD(P)-dependent dehydrogenase (short-subunit alcohol dehydrogenase family)